MTKRMTHREQQDWNDALIKMKKEWKAADAVREIEEQIKREQSLNYQEPDPDVGKVFHYEKECGLLDEYHDHFVKTGELLSFDIGNMKGRMAADERVWKLWKEEDLERQGRIKAACQEAGVPYVAPAVAAPRAGRVKKVIMPSPPPKPAKKAVRFVLPGEPGDPWEQEVSAGIARVQNMREEVPASSRCVFVCVCVCVLLLYFVSSRPRVVYNTFLIQDHKKPFSLFFFSLFFLSLIHHHFTETNQPENYPKQKPTPQTQWLLHYFRLPQRKTHGLRSLRPWSKVKVVPSHKKVWLRRRLRGRRGG